MSGGHAEACAIRAIGGIGPPLHEYKNDWAIGKLHVTVRSLDLEVATKLAVALRSLYPATGKKFRGVLKNSVEDPVADTQ